MLRLVIFFSFTLTVFCSDGEPDWLPGSFDQIVLDQRSPISSFYINQSQWPTENQRPQNFSLSNDTWTSLTRPLVWVVDAFWPSKFDGEHPSHCFDPRSVIRPLSLRSTLIAALRRAWPSYSSTVHENGVWNEAWRKHGTCMGFLEQIGSASDYFEKAVEMIRRYNIGFLLERTGLEAGSSYSLQTVVSAITKRISFDPHLRCIIDEDGVQYLSEATICLTLEFRLTECEIVPIPTCVPWEDVHIPILRSVT